MYKLHSILIKEYGHNKLIIYKESTNFVVTLILLLCLKSEAQKYVIFIMIIDKHYTTLLFEEKYN